MENGELERRLDLIENSFIRFEGKVDLINLQLETAASLTLERAGNTAAAIRLNQAAVERILSDLEELDDRVPRNLEHDVTDLKNWKRDMRVYGRGVMLAVAAIGSVTGSVITWAIIEAITRRH